MSKKNSPSKLLLLGWAGADWRVIQPLLDKGRMPHLESIINQGVMGKVFALPPSEPPGQWTTIATGQNADGHGILGQAMPDQEGFGIRPVDSTDMTAAPLWQILNRAGLPAAVVGWPVTHPATVFDGLIVSDAFAEARGNNFDEWPLRTDCVSDPNLRAKMSELRLHPAEITAQQVLPFIPEAARIDQETDERLPLLVASLARTASIHAAGTWIAENNKWGFLAVHFDLIERLSSAFMQYGSPRMSHISDRDFEIYQHVVDGAYQFMDMMLGRYLGLTDPSTHLMIVSDHGFLTDHLRPGPVKKGNETNKKLYREFGVFILNGPGIKQDELVFGATLLDIAPTVLSLLGLPVSREMEGRVLVQAFEKEITPEYVDAYPATIPDPRDLKIDKDWIAGRITELNTLGYITSLASDPEETSEKVTIERLLNLSLVLIMKREHKKAVLKLTDLLDLAPNHVDARFKMVQCSFALNDIPRCRKLLGDLVLSGLKGEMIDYFYGQLYLREGETKKAIEYLERSAHKGRGNRRLQERIGHVYLQAGQWPGAEIYFKKALEIDPDFAMAHKGLGLALANQKNHEQAIQQFLTSLGLLYHQPDTHFFLGNSLAALGKNGQAMEALQNALKIQPDFSQAKVLLKKIQTANLKQIIDPLLS